MCVPYNLNIKVKHILHNNKQKKIFCQNKITQRELLNLSHSENSSCWNKEISILKIAETMLQLTMKIVK